jgi:ribonucleoside-diphosphate reductase alpha chain
MQFDTTIDTWHTCKGTGRQNSTNPCSEYLFLDNTACNLASLNLLKFKKPDGAFDLERFKAAVRIFITAQEILVDNASYPIREIAENSHIFRTLGLGYDSDEARALAGAITAIMTGHAYEQSAALARVMQPFPGYHESRCSGVTNPPDKTNAPHMLKVMELHRSKVAEIQHSHRFSYLKDEAQRCWDAAVAAGRKHGYRNAQVTVLAPTGTIGFLMDCDTTGIEPDIALVKYKLLAGGGMLKIVNQTVKPALQNLGYDAAEIEGIIAHVDKYDTIEDIRDEQTGAIIPSGLRPGHLSVFDCAFKPARGARSLHYRGHIKMMAAAQPFLSGAISKTVNLPNDATVDDIMNTYIEGWRLGLKAIAIYRDGSKRSAPLATDKKTHSTSSSSSSSSSASGEVAPNALAEFDALLSTKTELESRIVALEHECDLLRAKCDEPVRRRMPETRVSITHKFEIAGHKGYLTVGLFEDGEPGELFIQMNKEGSTIGGLMDSVATLTSISLQYGVPLESLVKKFAFQRFEPSGFTKNPDIRQATSITDYIFRWLGCQFIKGYKEATSPNKGQQELPMKELEQIDKAAVNRPVAELALSPDKEIIDIITHEGNSENGAQSGAAVPRSVDQSAEGATSIPSATSSPANFAQSVATPTNGNGHTKTKVQRATHAERVKIALGNMYMESPCSHCGSPKVIRAGACGVCTDCGTSQGCS